MIKNSILNDYKIYWKNKFENIKMDNNIFKQIKRISNYKKKYDYPDSIEDENNTQFKTEKEKCEASYDIKKNSYDLFF